MRQLAAVVAGGLIGTGVRLALDTLIRHDDSGFPVSTLVINVVGAFALGLLVARVWPTAPDWVRAGLGAGVLGSFTTFSAVAVSVVSLTAAGVGWLAAVYLVVTLIAGFAAAFAGLSLGRRRTVRGER